MTKPAPEDALIEALHAFKSQGVGQNVPTFAQSIFGTTVTSTGPIRTRPTYHPALIDKPSMRSTMLNLRSAVRRVLKLRALGWVTNERRGVRGEYRGPPYRTLAK